MSQLGVARDSLGDDAGEDLVDRMKIAIARTSHELAPYANWLAPVKITSISSPSAYEVAFWL
jgi:hypothetical protein